MIFDGRVYWNNITRVIYSFKLFVKVTETRQGTSPFDQRKKTKRKKLKNKDTISFRHPKYQEPIHRLIPINGGINHPPRYLLGFSPLGSKRRRAKKGVCPSITSRYCVRTGPRGLLVVVDHEGGPKRNKIHDTSSIKLTAKMNTDVNVTRRFPENRIGTHGDTR